MMYKARTDYYTGMNSIIDWNIPAKEYVRIFDQIPQSNLLQSYEYSLACARVNFQRPNYGKIITGDKTAGIFMLLEAGIFKNMIHGLILDRGPLWLEGFGNQTENEEFFVHLAIRYPKRLGRKRRIIPEKSSDISKLHGNDYERLDRPGYQTIRLDLRPDEAVLRSNLKQKWRNILNKSEKLPFEIEWDIKRESWLEIRALYIEDRKKRGYPGPAVKLLDALVDEFARSQNLLAGRILLNGNLYAAMLIFRHGCSATWQVGWTSQKGRNTGAGYRLLWQACLELKDRGTDDFDLGGFNEADASGIKHFKSGTGGQEIRLAGHFT